MKDLSSDIHEIIAHFRRARPEILVEQLKVRHPGVDDDGLWFFKRANQVTEVQLESSTGNCPFLIETNSGGARVEAVSVERAISAIEELLA